MANGFIGCSMDNADLLLEKEAAEEYESGRYLGFSLYTDDIGKVYQDYTNKGVEFSQIFRKLPAKVDD